MFCDIEKDNLILVDKFSPGLGFELLYISICTNKSIFILNKFNSIKLLLNCDYPESTLYNKISIFLDVPDKANYKNCITHINTNNYKYITSPILKRLKEFLKEIHNDFITSNCDLKNYIGYFELENSLEICAIDNTELQLKYINLSYTLNEHKKYIPTKALFCPKCNRVYLNNIFLNNLKLRIPNGELNKLNNNVIPSSSNIKEKPIKKVIKKSTTTVTNVIKNDEPNLNNTSALRALGYKTSISREKRWDILTNKAIPTIGLDRTKYIIEFLINFNGKNSKNKNAKFEWEYDLKRLNKL